MLCRLFVSFRLFGRIKAHFADALKKQREAPLILCYLFREYYSVAYFLTIHPVKPLVL